MQHVVAGECSEDVVDDDEHDWSPPAFEDAADSCFANIFCCGVGALVGSTSASDGIAGIDEDDDSSTNGPVDVWQRLVNFPITSSKIEPLRLVEDKIDELLACTDDGLSLLPCISNDASEITLDRFSNKFDACCVVKPCVAECIIISSSFSSDSSSKTSPDSTSMTRGATKSSLTERRFCSSWIASPCELNKRCCNI
uniref:Uncharacterized protein n=1 Tax=Romanomermis culicivorax TaxID=13658 RepID=A0A915JLS1_ROMCU